jgi:2-phosphoglycerate kinase
MLYLLGGCSRSGKSTLAERMRVRHGVPWFPLDALKMGLHHGAPQLGVHSEHDELETADRMWPIVQAMVENLIFDGRDYLIEGVNLRPDTVASYIEQSEDPIRACFLGYPDLPVETKAAQVFAHAGLPNDWLNRMGPDYVARHLDQCRRLSAKLRDDCARLGLVFFDTGADFPSALETAERRLAGD